MVDISFLKKSQCHSGVLIRVEHVFLWVIVEVKTMPGVFRDQEGRNNTYPDDSFQFNPLTPPEVTTDTFVGSSKMKGGTKSRFPNGHNSDQRSDITDDGPRYLLEHLATFSVGPEYGLTTPKDGLRRLLQMEKTNGIWTQKMQLKLDKNWILILDYDDGDVVERFPMNLISDPTAYTSDDPRELYNNILVFIVRKDPKNQNPSEMHIFQCVHAYAQDVVDEIKMFLTGQAKAKYNENVRHLPPPPDNPPPEPPMDGTPTKSNVKEHVAMLTASSVSSPSPRPPQWRSSSNAQHMIERSERSAGYAHESNDETSSTASDKYEKEVMILNHCFDDIERFVVRLQHAAAAYKELERRQRSRKHKKKDMGDGMLSVRAKPPPERDFVDILQKFKLSFNLLAKLKSHIHDPNAPELVHFLFTPLALIVDAARDSNHSPNLAERVVSPLLTRDAIELLSNCCTSKETDLWHSLGDAWVVPRDQWKGYESSYNPVFSNGWAPENPIDTDTLSHRLRKSEADLHEQDFQHVLNHADRESRYGSEYFESERGDDPEGPESHAEASHLRPPFDHQFNHRAAAQRRDLLDRGSLLSPESDFHDPNDRDVRSEYSSDSIEHSDVPVNLQRQFDHRQMQWLEDLKNRRAKIVQVVYPRTANNDKELTVIRGEILEILDDSRKWWRARNMRGQIAHVPHTIVMPYPLTDDQIFNNPLYANRSSRESHSSGDSATIKERFIDERSVRPPDEVFPSSVVVPQPTPADWVRRERQGKKGEFRYF